jgi:hypothetical protein
MKLTDLACEDVESVRTSQDGILYRNIVKAFYLQAPRNRKIATSADTLDFPSNTTIHFIATQLHVSAHYRSIIRVSNKNSFKKGKHAYKVYTLFVFMRPQKLRQVTSYASLLCKLTAVISIKLLSKTLHFVL